ncbi:hypothetical protein BD311DRAFT_754972 [Dichomitus squalens]|uniref:Uncharacterized protein n=1 Tax=Dichomitus squalens TaxID=114155 RepID=A0A4Q9MQW5_9APHY|nr:hypothetical protein BD311DRAFT_754972 [Dichomitus squalens]
MRVFHEIMFVPSVHVFLFDLALIQSLSVHHRSRGPVARLLSSLFRPLSLPSYPSSLHRLLAALHSSVHVLLSSLLGYLRIRISASLSMIGLVASIAPRISQHPSRHRHAPAHDPDTPHLHY